MCIKAAVSKFTEFWDLVENSKSYFQTTPPSPSKLKNRLPNPSPSLAEVQHVSVRAVIGRQLLLPFNLIGGTKPSTQDFSSTSLSWWLK